MFEPLSRANFTWFTIDYRLAPENRWPACFDDVQTAIRWVKQHAAEFKGDPERIALIGYSAGGHLATLAGTDQARTRACKPWSVLRRRQTWWWTTNGGAG